MVHFGVGGGNNYGELGDGTNTAKYSPQQIGSDDKWVSIECGVFHTIALKSTGTLWGWGWNLDGELGDGTYINRNSPVQIGSDNTWLNSGGNAFHSIALHADGANFCATGTNSSGQLGDGTTVIKNIFVCNTNPCINPVVPTLSASSSANCGTVNTTLSIASGTLNNATNWQWYSTTCGGTSAGAGTSINVSPTSTTTYYARGTGGCVTPGSCGTITINVNNPPSISETHINVTCFGGNDGSINITVTADGVCGRRRRAIQRC